MVYVLQCDPEVPSGLTTGELDRLSIPWLIVRLDRGELLPAVEEKDAIILLGGRMSANDEAAFPFLRRLKPFVRETVTADIRFLGICLGGQLLAAAFGSEVVEKRWGERGNCKVQLTSAGCDDALLAGLPKHIPAFQWHNDSFDLPEGAALLASSELCPHQAFRVGDNGWGLQFHPEVTPEIIGAWASLCPGSSASRFIAGWMQREQQYRQVMSVLMQNFLKQPVFNIESL